MAGGYPGIRLPGCLVERHEVRGGAAAAHLSLGYDRQIELRAVGELGENATGVWLASSTRKG